jgi:hypothetical protein
MHKLLSNMFLMGENRDKKGPAPLAMAMARAPHRAESRIPRAGHPHLESTPAHSNCHQRHTMSINELS